MSEIKLEMNEHIVPIEEVIPYDKNPKVHGDEQIKFLAEHIRNVGFDQPIVVDEHGVIIKGHGRLEALKYLGSETALIKVRHGLTDAQKKAARVADNKLAELATDHDEYLKIELQELAVMDVDLKSLGFSDVELTELKVEFPGFDDADKEDIEDEVPDIPEDENPYGVKRGDIWLLGAYLECDSCNQKFEYHKAKVDQVCEACNA